MLYMWNKDIAAKRPMQCNAKPTVNAPILINPQSFRLPVALGNQGRPKAVEPISIPREDSVGRRCGLDSLGMFCLLRLAILLLLLGFQAALLSSNHICRVLVTVSLAQHVACHGREENRYGDSPFHRS